MQMLAQANHQLATAAYFASGVAEKAVGELNQA
jgi:hypothetical protein